MCCSVLQYVAGCCRVLQCVAVCCSVLQCVAVCCSVLQCASCKSWPLNQWISVKDLSILSLLYVSFAKETYNFIDFTSRSQPITISQGPLNIVKRAPSIFTRSPIYTQKSPIYTKEPTISLSISQGPLNIVFFIGLFCKRDLQLYRFYYPSVKDLSILT